MNLNLESSFILKRTQITGDKNVGHLKVVATIMNKRSLKYWDHIIESKPDYLTIVLPIQIWIDLLQNCMNILTDQYYVIIEGGSAIFGNYLADFAQCLIDADHPGPSCLFLTNIRKNLLNMRVGTLEAKICFKPTYVFNMPMEDVYNHQIFFQTPEILNIDRIDKLVRSSLGANGIDVIFQKSYTIKAQGVLILDIPWSDNFDFKDRPNLIIVRSRFARLGIKLSVCPLTRSIILINDSNENINLGNKFFQIVPSISQQFYFDYEYIIKKIIGNSVGINYELIIKERKNKIERLEEENTFILKACGFF